MSITAKELARKLGLSAAAVSMALNNKPGVSESTRQKVQEIIAQEMNVPLSQVFGVATLYSQFTLTPKGEHTVSVCLGTACYVKGADKILAAIEDRLGIKAGECTPDGFFSIDSCRCLGACGLAPVMTVDGEVYGKCTPESAVKIIDSYYEEV